MTIAELIKYCTRIITCLSCVPPQLCRSTLPVLYEVTLVLSDAFDRRALPIVQSPLSSYREIEGIPRSQQILPGALRHPLFAL